MDGKYSSASPTGVIKGSACTTYICTGRCIEFTTVPTYTNRESSFINKLSSCRTRCVFCGFYYWKCAICVKFGYDCFIKSKLAQHNALFRDVMVEHINKIHTYGIGRPLPVEENTIMVDLAYLEGFAVMSVDFTKITSMHPHIVIMHIVDYDTIIHPASCLKLDIDDHISTMDRTLSLGKHIVRLDPQDIQRIMDMLMRCNWECGICGAEFDGLPSFEVFMDHYASHAA